MLGDYTSIIFFVAIIICVLYGIYSKNKREKEENKILSVYGYIYKVKEISNILGNIKKYRSEISNHLVTIEQKDLVLIEEYYFRKLHAIIIKLYVEYEKTFGFISNRLFINNALKKNDYSFINVFQNSFYGNSKPYNIDEIMESELINAINKCGKVEEKV